MNKAFAILLFLTYAICLRAQSISDKANFRSLNPNGLGSFNRPVGFSQINKDSVKISLTNKKHSPKKATIYSLVLPGLGQAYNRKYWKIPIIYTGLVGTGMFLYYSRDQMMQRQDALIAIKDGDPLTVPSPKYANTSEQQLKADRDYYRANADYAIIALAIFYTLNVIDAAVDAHFYNFNIDKPLAMQKKRHLYAASSQVRNLPTIGVAYRF